MKVNTNEEGKGRKLIKEWRSKKSQKRANTKEEGKSKKRALLRKRGEQQIAYCG